jgi:hypothetical protein
MKVYLEPWLNLVFLGTYLFNQSSFLLNVQWKYLTLM